MHLNLVAILKSLCISTYFRNRIVIDKIRIIELLCGLFAVSQLFVLGACAVMNGTRRSSKSWFFATAMLHWSAAESAAQSAAREMFNLFVSELVWS